MELEPADLFLLLAGAALVSSAITLAVLTLVFRLRIQPRLERRLDERMSRAADEVEERIRGRLAELLGGRSREFLQERAREWARTGRDLLAPRRPPGYGPDRDDYE